MRQEFSNLLETFRMTDPKFQMATVRGETHGCFLIERNGKTLRVISSGHCGGPENNTEWEHVSVSLKSRVPTWAEMCFVKDLFFAEDETVVQFHPKKTNYKNLHQYCLHLWKKGEHELPPDIMV